MKKFLLLYRAPTTARAQMAKATPEQMKAGMDAWMGWQKKNAKAIVDFGSPIGDPKLSSGAKAAGAGDQTIGGYSVVQAESADALQKLIKDHPHFMTPGGATIEAFEFLLMPGM